MNADTSPIESGLMPFVRMDKPTEFVGRAGLARLLESPAEKTVALVAVQDCETDPEGDESVMAAGKVVGFTTSGCYRLIFVCGKHCGFMCVSVRPWEAGWRW